MNQSLANQKKRISLRWKWTTGAAIAIFLTYTIFSTILYVTFQQIMLENEEDSLRETIQILSDRFGSQFYALTEESVAETLELNQLQLLPSYSETKDKSTVSTTPLGTSPGGMFIRVYNNNAKLLYESSTVDASFEQTDELRVDTIDGPNGEAFSARTPIFSYLNNRQIGYLQVVNTLESYHRLSNSILMAILVTGLIALMFSAIIGYMIARRFLLPIRKVTDAMKKIENDPDYVDRIDAGNGQDELTDLANAYNSMLSRMQKNIEHQKQFVEDVSHELRTPVAVVEGHLKLLNRWGKDDPTVLEESLDASLQEIERMKSLVQEMLDLSRAEQVEIHYKNEKTPVRQIINATYNNIQLVHPDFTFILDDDLREEIYVNIYRNHLEQILIILLDNAVKYSTDRKEVHLSVSMSDKKVQIVIQDYGEGMSEEDTEKIFNRFYRIDKARSRYKGGNGLGLSIAKELLEGYKGKIWAESVLDHGSIFRIILPILETESDKDSTEKESQVEE
ncbi:sensor histidine kinase [Marinilactibacillus psychrotolerans]|uniref:sensor histidine kinase n=1 Tax=Marinilactibacillus psychrotolerans TaxID=191770 RepID=UPI0039B04165